MTGPDTRWVIFIRGDDRAGTITAVTGVFSSRGVSFESFATGDVQDGAGLMPVVFRASERLAGVLVRTLERLTAVHSVRIERADSAEVRAIGGIVHVDGTHSTLLGTLAEVETALAATRGVLAILPPE